MVGGVPQCGTIKQTEKITGAAAGKVLGGGDGEDKAVPAGAAGVAGDNGENEGGGKGGSGGGVFGIMVVFPEKMEWSVVEGMASEVVGGVCEPKSSIWGDEGRPIKG